MLRVAASLLCVVLLATACSTPRTSAGVRFNEQERADLIVRYYSDDTSYVLKPEKTDGPFLSILKRDDVLAVAKHQPGREMAVVILIHYISESEEQAVQSKWTAVLTKLGFQHVVFLRGFGSRKVNGLAVLAQADRSPALSTN